MPRLPGSVRETTGLTTLTSPCHVQLSPFFVHILRASASLRGMAKAMRGPHVRIRSGGTNCRRVEKDRRRPCQPRAASWSNSSGEWRAKPRSHGHQMLAELDRESAKAERASRSRSGSSGHWAAPAQSPWPASLDSCLLAWYIGRSVGCHLNNAKSELLKNMLCRRVCPGKGRSTVSFKVSGNPESDE